MRRRFIFFFLIPLFLLGGCQGISLSNQKEKKTTDNRKTEVVYSPWENKLLYYDTENIMVKYYNNTENVFQYSFSTPCDYFTSGHSINNGFEILKVENGNINSIYKLEDNEIGIFPLVQYKDRLFFIMTFYKEGLANESIICEFKGNELIKYKNTTDIISGDGAVINNKIYYTVYDSMNKEFSVYSIDIDSYNAYPKKIKCGIYEDSLLAISDELYYRENDNFKSMNSDSLFKAGFIDQYDPQYNLLFQFNLSDKDQRFIELSVFNMDNLEEVYGNNNIIGYKIKDDKLYIYDTNGTLEINILNIKCNKKV